jgi:hypothetical protein
MLVIENAGQWPAAARFQVWNSPLGAGTTWLANDAIWLVVGGGRSQVAGGKLQVAGCKWQVAGSEAPADPLADLQPANLPPATLHALKLTFPGSNPDVRIEPFDALTTTVSYFIGNDPAQWRPAVPVWGGVRYVDLYPGVDLVLGGRDGDWRLEAASGAMTNQVRVQVEGAEITVIDRALLQLDAAGDTLSVVVPEASFVYQAACVSRHGDPQALVIHPDRQIQHARPTDDSGDLLYSTFLGGSGADYGVDIAIDGAGSAYVVGHTYSTDFPTTPGAFDPSFNGYFDAFAVKLNSDGSGLTYATFLGSNGPDVGAAIAVDDAGSAYVVGWTFGGFPTTPGVFDPSYGGGYGPDAYVVKLNPAGSELTYATYLGSVNVDEGYAVAVDGVGSAYVMGRTESSGFPTTLGAFDTSYNGGGDAFVVKLNPTGSALVFATFLGGGDAEWANAIAVGEAGSAYVTSFTRSGDFPTTPGAYDTSFSGGDCGGYLCSDAFVAKLNLTGSELAYATYLGGSRGDSGEGIAIDGAGSAYVTGNTGSTDFPATPGSFDTSYDGGDAFVVKLDPAGSALAYSTLLGGGSADYGGGITIDGPGSAYVTGNTASTDFPTTPGAYDSSYNGGSAFGGDAFVAKLNPIGSGLAYATFLGGAEDDRGRAIAVNGTGIAYVIGQTNSSGFPTTPGVIAPAFNGGDYDAFVSKLNTAPYSPNVLAPIEQPPAGAFVSGVVTLRGFAIDRASTAGTGIDMVHIYLDGPYGTGTTIGAATYGLDRSDIAAQYGARFGPSGWELAWDTSGLTPGVHRLYLYAHRTTDNAWSLMDPHLVVVPGGPARWLPIVLRQQ